MEFSINLDRLAPLGDGEGNLAEWLHDFDFGGARSTESGGVAQGDLFGRPTSVWDEQNPLLIEAEAWVDQATCLFYPEIYKIQGWSTSVPNLRMLLTLARSWVARGLSNHDATEGRADMRRAIRLGRLLRQDSFTIIQEMVGLSTIRRGAEGLYELARREGDATEMVLAGQVMADVDGIRALMQEKLSDIFDLEGALRGGSLARWLKDSEAGLGRIAKTALADGLRPLRAEAVMALGFALRVGGRAQRETSRTVLLQVVEQRDPVLAASAAWFLEKADRPGG